MSTLRPIDEVIEVFGRWLILKDPTPLYAVFGAVAANLLEGDPVWLGLIAPPSSAKTEILNSLSELPHVVQASSLTPASFLSATSKKDQSQAATGGLLAQIGKFGIIVLKDFTTMLSLRPEANQEVFAILREVYDGHYTRHVGTDGGRALTWNGKVGLVFACTETVDKHHSVVSAMGDRYLLCRIGPVEGQFERALDHAGEATERMRRELLEVVVRLFDARSAQPRPLSLEERGRISRICSVVVRLRAAVDRDRYSTEIQVVHGAEGTGRLGLSLERLLAGLDTLGVDRDVALNVVEAVAMDSTPPIRRRAYEYLRRITPRTAEIADIAVNVRIPEKTLRRHLEDLEAQGLVRHVPAEEREEKGKADVWYAL
jgi:DNA-binding transcriptional ArsR family regulator